MLTATKPETVGVVGGRFQEPDPREHPGHIATIEHALSRHKDVLILLGVYEESPADDRNPLSYRSRRWAIKSAFPQRSLRFSPLPSHRKPYTYRSTQVDAIIKREFPGYDAVIYGSRDGIYGTYEGEFRKEFVPQVFDGSATQIRESIEEIDSVDFRKGVVWANVHRRKLVYPTVDVVIQQPNLGRVILVRKPDEDEWRFPGVFFDPDTDFNYEAAALRAVSKEVPTVTTQEPQLIQSQRIDDWRYRKSRDGVMTLLMKTPHSGGEPTPGTGIAEACWFEYGEVTPELLVPEHRVLGEIMSKRWFY